MYQNFMLQKYVKKYYSIQNLNHRKIFWHLRAFKSQKFITLSNTHVDLFRRKDIVIHNPNIINSLSMSSNTKRRNIHVHINFPCHLPQLHDLSVRDLIMQDKQKLSCLQTYLSPTIEQRMGIINVRIEKRKYVEETNQGVIICFTKNSLNHLNESSLIFLQKAQLNLITKLQKKYRNLDVGFIQEVIECITHDFKQIYLIYYRRHYLIIAI